MFLYICSITLFHISSHGIVGHEIGVILFFESSSNCNEILLSPNIYATNFGFTLYAYGS